jgi:SAM-dependent methyltransferase
MVDLVSFRQLLTPAGQEALDAAQALQPREVDFLNHFTQLQRVYPSELARSALEIAILRAEAAEKFPNAGQLYFTRQALEQASGAPVANYRERRFISFTRLADLGCSVGGDTLAMAQAGHELVIGIDQDLLRLEMARANLAALDRRNAHVIAADLTHPLPFSLDASIGLFFDPARREPSGERIHSVNAYHPPLRVIDGWLERCPNLGVKLSPGVNLAELGAYDAAAYNAEVEFISYKGELKEAVLWFGPLKSALRRATLLPGPHTLMGDPGAESEIRLDQPREYLYEPDPAVLRAGLVRNLARQHGLAQLDPEIAYLTGDRLVRTPFARAWRVEAWFPFNLKRLRSELRARDVGEVVVKKRGSPIQPEWLIQALRLKGNQSRLVFLTQVRGKPTVILGAWLESPGA